MRIFPWLSVYKSINFQKIYYHFKVENYCFITKINIFSGLESKYWCLLLSLSWRMRRKRKYYKQVLQREKLTAGILRNLTDSPRKWHKRARDKILIHTKVYLWDQYERWTKRNQELSETHFPRICLISFPFLWPGCT